VTTFYVHFLWASLKEPVSFAGQSGAIWKEVSNCQILRRLGVCDMESTAKSVECSKVKLRKVM
jgi:hypothetical protein